MSDKENALGLETADDFKFYAFQRQNVPEAFPEFHKDTPSGKGGAKGLQVFALLLLLLASEWQPGVVAQHPSMLPRLCQGQNPPLYTTNPLQLRSGQHARHSILINPWRLQEELAVGVDDTEGNNGIMCRPFMAELMAYASLAAHKPGSQAEADSREKAADPAETESSSGEALARQPDQALLGVLCGIP